MARSSFSLHSARVLADTPYLEYFHSLAEQASTGYALVPDVGGGTNRSEFELLTGNSMDLLPGITPFSTLSMEGQPSVVSYLESLGYTTLAAHPALPANYRRGTAWPALGFDTTAITIKFGQESRAASPAFSPSRA